MSLTDPDVARSMAAHPSSRSPRVAHLGCGARRICSDIGVRRILTDDEFRARQLCVVCADLASQPCPHCGQLHEWPT